MSLKSEPQGFVKRRKEALAKNQEEMQEELKTALRIILRGEEGLKVFRYLFGLSGGESSLIRLDNQGKVDPLQTLVLQARKDMYSEVRHYIDSDTIKKIERHFWED